MAADLSRLRWIITLAAGAINQAVATFALFVQVPFLMSYWGPERLGGWLVLCAIPQYLAASDFGLGSAAKTDITRKVEDGDFVGASVVYSSVLSSIFTLFFTLLGIFVLVLISLDVRTVLNLLWISRQDVDVALIVLLFYVVAVQMLPIVAGLARAHRQPAIEVAVVGIGRMLDVITVIIVAAVGGDIVSAAVGMTLSRALLLLTFFIISTRLYPRVRWHWGLVRIHSVFALARPAFGFFLVPLALVIFGQGTTIVVSAALGPAAVAVLTIHRMVARLITSVSATLGFSFTPEYTYALASSDLQQLRRLVRRHVALGALVVGVGCVSIFLVGPYVINLVSRGEVSIDWTITIFILSAAIFESLYNGIFSFLAAKNSVFRLGFAQATIAFISVLICTVVAGSGLSAVTLVNMVGTGVIFLSSLFIVREVGKEMFTG